MKILFLTSILSMSMTSERDGSWGGGTPPVRFTPYSKPASEALSGGSEGYEGVPDDEYVFETIGDVDLFVDTSFKQLEAVEGVKVLPLSASHYLIALDQMEKKGDVKVLMQCGRVVVFSDREGRLEDRHQEARLVLKDR